MKKLSCFRYILKSYGDKYDFNSLLPVLLLSFILIGCQQNTAHQGQTTTVERPNVIFILADDLGYYDLSCTGSKFYETPNIDQIAKEGTAFTQGYANCRVCSPSRASIMTGQFTARHGITDWIGAKSGTDWREKKRYSKLLPADYMLQLSSTHKTLAEAMKAADYQTFFAGKWHLGGVGSYPEDHGFDINRGGWGKGSPAGGYFAPHNNPKLEDGPPGENLTKRLAKETVDFIKGHRDVPFFAFLSFYAVHTPIQSTKEKWQKYRDKAEDMGIEQVGFEMEREFPVRIVQDDPVYAGLVESLDDAVGVVLKGLKDAGVADNTIVIFTSDNGGMISPGTPTSNLPLRGGKGYQWEGGIREPFFIKVPFIEKSEKQVEVPVTGADFYPTILDLTGIPMNPTQHVDGVSLVPLIKGNGIPERALFWHYPHYGNQGGEPSSIIRKGDWKLIHYWEDSHQELYNLKKDQGEQFNLANEQSEVAQKLSKKLLNWLKDMGAKTPIPDPEYDEVLDMKRRKQLKNKKLKDVEKQRLRRLQKQWQPNQNWWGSQTVSD